MNDKKIIFLTLGIIVLVLGVGTAISYAFIGSANVTNNGANVSGDIINAGNGYNVTLTGNTALSLNVTLDDLSSLNSSNDYSNYIESNTTVDIKVTADTEIIPDGVDCDYDIYYTPTTSYNASEGAKASSLKELAITGSSNLGSSFAPISLDGINGKTKIYSGSVTSTLSGTNDREHWTFSLRFYNLNVDQASSLGQTPAGKVSVEIGKCYVHENLETLSSHVKAQYTSQGVAVGDGVLYLHDSTLENSANDGSYRYAGADPDNYLCFKGDTCDDDHKYRIIGIFGENIKVIKMTSVGSKVWNSSDVNTWEDSTMDTYLNGEWLTSFGHGDLIEDYDWHVGGHNSPSVTAKVVHDVEMGSSPVVNRKVGLIYASDFGYGALNNYWTTDLYSYDGGAKNTDWLYLKVDEWTISRYSGNSSYAFFVISTGFVNGNYSVTSSFASRPSFYLKSSVKIASGTGTSTDPYIIK